MSNSEANTSLPREMRAIQVVAFDEPYQVNNVPVPSVTEPTDVILKVAVASHCHTDSMVQAGVVGTRLPCSASHEGSGTVVALGDAAREQGFAIGQRVMAGILFGPCGKCESCLGPKQYQHHCGEPAGYIGIHIDGCFAEYVKADARSSTILPDEVSFLSAAPLACAGRTAWRGVLQADLQPGQWLAIVGSGGGLGHLAIQFAKALGLKVIGVDARDEGLRLSEELGADVVLDARKGKEFVVQEVQRVTGGRRAESTICLSDHRDATSISCGTTRAHGNLIQIGQPVEICYPFEELIVRDIRIRGSLMCSAEESTTMLECVVKHDIMVKKEIFHGFDSIEKILELVHGGKVRGKAVMVIDEEQVKKDEENGANA